MTLPSAPMVEGIAGPGAARARRRRARRGGVANRPGWLTYVLLGLVIALSAYPLYYSFLLG